MFYNEKATANYSWRSIRAMVNFAATMAAAMPSQKIGINFASCHRDWPDYAVSTHFCSTTSPHCNNPLYLLHSMPCLLLGTWNSALRTFSRLLPSFVVVVPPPTPAITPVSRFGSSLIFNYFPLCHLSPQWRRYPSKISFFATISRKCVSKIHLSRHALHFSLFYSLLSLLSLLSTQNLVLLLLV
jgi:hypothetical protein